MSKHLKKNDSHSRSFMTAKQRSALKKVDKKLGVFFCKLDKKRARLNEKWTEEKWEEELADHPFVIKTTAQSSEAAQLADCLNILMYQPNGLSPVDRGISYNDGGNFCCKRHYYGLAILSYSLGIKETYGDKLLRAKLYTNRAAAQYKIKNYYSALHDSEQATYSICEYKKAHIVAAKSAMELAEWVSVTSHCMSLLLIQPRTQGIPKIMNRARTKRYLFEVNIAVKAMQSTAQREILAKSIIENGARAITLNNTEDPNWELIPGCKDIYVHKISGHTKRSIILHYAEDNMTDYINGLFDDIPIRKQVESVLPAAWDTRKKYSRCTIFVVGLAKKLYPIDVLKTVNSLIRENVLDYKQDPPIVIIVPDCALSALNVYEMCEVREGRWFLSLYVMPKEGTSAG